MVNLYMLRFPRPYAVGFPVGGITECDEYGDGMELSEEFGEKARYSMTRPISESLSTRPRRFKDIPELQPSPSMPRRC